MPSPASGFRSKISTSGRRCLSLQRLHCCRFRCERANDLVVDRRNISRRRGYRDACLWFFSQKDQIRAALRGPEQQRKEPRTPRRVALELSGSDKPLIYEITITENVSRHGARVVTNRRWYPHDSVLVRLPEEVLPARARITYCQPLRGAEFAMGLQFSLAVYSWIGSPQ